MEVSPSGDELTALFHDIGERLAAWEATLDSAASTSRSEEESAVAAVTAPPGKRPRPLKEVLDLLEVAGAVGVETGGWRFAAHLGGDGDVLSAAAAGYTLGLNRFGGVAAMTPALAAMERGILSWLADLLGMPPGSGGLMTTGGSQSILSAVLYARNLVREDISRGRIYLSSATNHVVRKMVHIAGMPHDAVRVLPTADDVVVDPAAIATAIEQDQAAGLNPILVIGNAGTTNTGHCDPLAELAALAHAAGARFHVDACYGGAFMLTRRGRALMAGIGTADSISVDAHKAFFVPFGTAALLVRDLDELADAHNPSPVDRAYLRDVDLSIDDFAELGIELSREPRGPRMWLPLQVRGTQHYTAALDSVLDIAGRLAAALDSDPRIEIPFTPPLSVVLFRMRDGDAATSLLCETINASGRLLVSSTVLDGRVYARICVLSRRMGREHEAEVLDVIRAAVDTAPARCSQVN